MLNLIEKWVTKKTTKKHIMELTNLVPFHCLGVVLTTIRRRLDHQTLAWE